MKNILQNLEEMTVSNVAEKFNYINTKELTTGFSSVGLIVDFAKNIFFGSMHRNLFVVCYKDTER